MRTYTRIILVLIAAACMSVGMAGTGWAGEPRSDVVGEVDIQTQIDRRIDSESADRQAIQDLLRRPDVRRIAGAAGLDIERASAAAAVLSGPELQEIAARAQAINSGVGGVEKVTLSITAIVIILLLIIILAS